MAAKRISSLLNFPSSNSDQKAGHEQQHGRRRSSDQLTSPSHQGLSIFSRKLSKALHERASGQLLSPPEDRSPTSPVSTSNKSSPVIPAVSELPANEAQTLSPVVLDSTPQLVVPRTRPSSRPATRPASPTLDAVTDAPSRTTSPPLAGGKSKRLTWLPGRSRSNSRVENPASPGVWIIERDGKRPYDMTRLIGGDTVPELWHEFGDTFVYLFPHHSGKGPAFRIDSAVYASSTVLRQLATSGTIGDLAAPSDGSVATVDPPGSEDTDDSAAVGASSHSSNSATQHFHLYLPLALTEQAIALLTPGAPEPSPNDIDILVAVRNTFAFLLGQSLVATDRDPNLFAVFMKISEVLTAYGFSNIDGSTYGEVAATSFGHYVDELGLADVRESPEKTLEALVLGEHMRSIVLYNEAFVHAVGKYDEITNLEAPTFPLISSITRNRMERAYMDLLARLKNIDNRLGDFDFPAIFSGIMNSRTADERKIVRFDEWKASFMSIRKHVLSYYKRKYGSWPPKASSKKNNLETSGLNRIVLKDLYSDFSDVYDLLVDRSNLTTRTDDAVVENDGTNDLEGTIRRAMRTVLSEYDHSLPPVQPPVPFDTPLLPSPTNGSKDPNPGFSRKDAKTRSKKLRHEECAAVLEASHNKDYNASSPFVEAFCEFERKSGHGKSIDELCDHRNGHWIFIYAVLQALPMLVVDAPGVKWTEGVEYFLCEPPRSGVPWARDDPGLRKSWYGVAGSSGVVSLPADLVKHGVEGIYRRSHCWQMAEKWSLQNQMPPVPPSLRVETALPNMPAVRAEQSAGLSPGNRRSVMDLGLAALPVPAGAVPASPVMRPHVVKDPTKTFDAIIGEPAVPTKGKKKK